MKKKVLISSISALAVLTLASCGEAVKEGSYAKGSDGAYALVDYSESVNYSELNKLDSVKEFVTTDSFQDTLSFRFFPYIYRKHLR